MNITFLVARSELNVKEFLNTTTTILRHMREKNRELFFTPIECFKNFLVDFYCGENEDDKIFCCDIEHKLDTPRTNVTFRQNFTFTGFISKIIQNFYYCFRN